MLKPAPKDKATAINLPPTGSGGKQSPAPSTHILLLPGWQGSGPGHWQTRWAQRQGHQTLEQSDWNWPRRGDWMARLEEVVLASSAPLLLVAHSLGCHLVAAWAAHSSHHNRIRAAMLVAPPDLDRSDLPPNLFSWRPISRQRLPFTSHVIASSNDPYAGLETSMALATAWGSAVTVVGDCGHVNGESGLGDWEQGYSVVESLVGDAGK